MGIYGTWFVSNEEKYRLFSASHVAVATLLGGPLAGGILMATNERRLGRSRAAILVAGLGLILTLGLLIARFYSRPLFWWPLAGAGILAMWQLAVRWQGAAIRAHLEVKAPLASAGTAIAVGIGSAVCMLCASMALALLFWREVSTAMSRTFYGSCDMRGAHAPATSGGLSQTCVEFMGVDANGGADAHRVCKDKWSTSHCDRKDAVGGCRSPSLTFWYYPSDTVARPADVRLGARSILPVLRLTCRG